MSDDATPATRARGPLVWLFTAAIFLNALLLFLVQPMFGKMVLPLVGGAPAVWNTCLLFFQSSLLAGYLYAHLVAGRLAPRAIVVLHVALLALAALTLPLGVPDGVTPVVAAPTLWLLGLLATSIGLPFTVLSAGSPLLQHLFARSGHPARDDPYFLYAASNVGSLGALLAYPLLVEPWLTLRAQGWAWTAGYVLLVVLVAAAGLLAARGASGRVTAAPVPDASLARQADVTWRDRLWWLALSFAPNSLLLGITAYITTDIAAVPLIWVLPLGLYLLSFVLAFGAHSERWRRIAFRYTPISFVAMSALVFWGDSPRGVALVVVPALCFFVFALLCHGELYVRRPAASRLTEFYLVVSLGGVLGGTFNVLVAPVAFVTTLELPIALALVAFLIPGERRHFEPVHRYALTAFAVLMAFAVLERDGTNWENNKVVAAVLVFVIATVFWLVRRQAVAFGLAVAIVLLAAEVRTRTVPGVIHRDRSFFGEQTIRRYEYAGETLHFFTHGRTLHGAQQRDLEWRTTPLTYYAPEGPLGELFFRVNQTPTPKQVGVLGLGVGTTAAYSHEEDRFTFFEIDPTVERLARDTTFFTFLADAAGEVEVVLGDARLTMAQQPDGRFDLLVVDAFSSDAIPVHLLTREAVELYVRKLAPGGLVAFHVSNRYLDLAVVVEAIARELGLVARERWDVAPYEPRAIARMRRLTSHWVVLARSEADLESLNATAWTPINARSDVRPWTDDWSNVVGVMRWGMKSPARVEVVE